MLAPVGLDVSGDGPETAAGDGLYLEVRVNGADRGFAQFHYRDGDVYASAAVLRRLGFRLPADVQDPVRISSLQGVRVQYDAPRQSIAIDAPLQLLDLPKTVLGAPQAGVPRATASLGALLNYDLYGTLDEHGTHNLSAFAELRAFNRFGVLSSTQLTQFNQTTSSASQSRTERLDTSWTTSFPEQMWTLRVGDVLTNALSWTRATRIGGVQFGTDFALQPYRITAPLPAFFGSATLPSDVELYINGVRQYSGQVPAGPFQLNSVPNVNGVGNAQVVLTDALGRSTTLNFSLYGTHRLLAEGLADWSAEVGVVRENYGVKSFDYGSDPAASGTWRYGVTSQFTAEGHVEATAGLANAGAGGLWRVGELGVISGALARSSYRGMSGSQVTLGYDWSVNRFNVNLEAARTQGDYRDTASLYGATPARVSGHASAGYATDNFGNFNIGYLHLRYPQQAATRYATGYWFKSLGHTMSLNFSLNQNLDKPSDRTAFFGFTMALGRQTTVGSSVQHSTARTIYSVNAIQSLPTEGGFGWRAQANGGDGASGGVAELDYLGRYGRIDIGASATGSNRFAYANAQGSLIWMEGHAFAARHMDQSFALVSTDGVAGVPVALENRPIGKTDADGLLLVTPLNAYQDNRIDIDPMQLPADLRIERVHALATPRERSGTLVRFGMTPIRAATVILVDPGQTPLPLGSEVRIAGREGEPALVGLDGVVYLDALESNNTLDVATKGGTCHVRFDYQKNGDSIPQIGPLVCRKELP